MEKKIFSLALLLTISPFLLAQDGSLSNIKSAKHTLIQVFQNYVGENVEGINFNYHRSYYYSGHYSKPYETKKYRFKGSMVIYSSRKLVNIDTSIDENKYKNRLIIGKKGYYENDSLAEMSTEEYYSSLEETYVLHPSAFLIFALSQPSRNVLTDSGEGSVIHHIGYNGIHYIASISKDFRIDYILQLVYDPLLGDQVVKSTYTHDANGKVNNVLVTKNGRLFQEITLSYGMPSSSLGNLLNKLKSSEPEINRLSKRAFFVQFKDENSQSLIIEADSFFVVIEAPIKITNGAALIQAARTIDPQKPVKYFIAGHHHPHYTGGMIAFVENESIIVGHESNQLYYQDIVSATRYLNEFEKSPNKPLLFEKVENQYTIGEGENRLEVYHIGNESNHTEDYLIFYMPLEKAMFVGDLVFIKENGPLTKASSRQTGLYQFITRNGLEVNTIYQSWPVGKYGYKSEISFSELKNSIEIE